MKPQHLKAIAAVAAALYLIAFAYVALDASAGVSLKERRQADFASFAKLISEIPYLPAAPKSSEPLLIRLQKILDQMDFSDRSPKLSGGGASPVTLSLEGVPFDRISRLFELLAADPNMATRSFRIERSGASADRFDFSASFTE